MLKFRNNPRLTRLSVAALAALISAGAVGCDNAQFTPDARSGTPQAPASTTSSAAQAAESPQPHLTDYSRLLLEAGDLSDQDDTFAERSSAATPNGLPGASTLFVNADDTRAISVTVAVYPGAADGQRDPAPGGRHGEHRGHRRRPDSVAGRNRRHA